jgi:hypothetical protein
MVQKERADAPFVEDVFFPGLCLDLINKHLAVALPGATMSKIATTPLSTPVDGSSSNGFGSTPTLVHDNDFLSWYFVEGITNSNFQSSPTDSDGLHHCRPTVRSYVKEPGFLDCHPRKSLPKKKNAKVAITILLLLCCNVIYWQFAWPRRLCLPSLVPVEDIGVRTNSIPNSYRTQ